MSEVTTIEAYKQEQENMLDDYYSLYEDLINMDKSRSEALEIVREVKASERKYLDSLEESNIKRRLVYSTNFLNRNFNWDNLTTQDKKDLCFNIGIKGKFYEGKEWGFIEGTTEKGLRRVVYGEERIDEVWVNARTDNGRGEKVASEEAQDAYRAMKDLNKERNK